MIRLLFAMLVLALAVGLSGWIVAQTGDGAGGVAKRPLDLPSGGRGDDEDEEDAPEIITYYGSEYEGDGFFWCLDTSGSMQGQKIQTLKQETTQAITSLSRSAEFSIVAFDSNTTVWSPMPRRADPGTKAAAIAWVQTLAAGGWTCLAPAGVQTLNICNQSGKRRRQVLILSDGAPWCFDEDTTEQCLNDITAANWQGTPINTLFIGNDAAGIEFMQTLAALNNGTFVNVN